MYTNTKNAANAYAKVGLETSVMAASPHKLIVMLFDGAKMAVNNALLHMRAGEIEAKGKAISKALAIINDGLHASLDMTAGGELAANLAALYDYMTQRLLTANLKNDSSMLVEVDGLLEQLRLGWVEIGTSEATGAATSTEPTIETASSTAPPAGFPNASKMSAYSSAMPSARPAVRA